MYQSRIWGSPHVHVSNGLADYLYAAPIHLSTRRHCGSVGRILLLICARHYVCRAPVRRSEAFHFRFKAHQRTSGRAARLLLHRMAHGRWRCGFGPLAARPRAVAGGRRSIGRLSMPTPSPSCVCGCFGGWPITGVTYKFTLSKYDSLGRASASALTALLTVVAQLFTTSRQSTSAQGLEVHEVVGGQHISHTSVRTFY